MSENQIEHNAVYYNPYVDEIFLGYVSLNDWTDLGMGMFWSQRLVSENPQHGGTRKYLRGLIKIGEL